MGQMLGWLVQKVFRSVVSKIRRHGKKILEFLLKYIFISKE